MKIKAELVQGSNNTVAKVPIYTFRLTFPKKNWLLDFFGLSKYFERRLTATILSTDMYVDDLLAPLKSVASDSTYIALHEQVCEIKALCEKVFAAVDNGGRLNGADVMKALNLFGPRFQEVLRQYKPGEKHIPCFPSTSHVYMATTYGWMYIG